MVSWIRLVSESGFEQKELKISAEIDICDCRMWFSWIQRHRPEVVCVCIGDHGDGLDLRLRGRAYCAQVNSL